MRLRLESGLVGVPSWETMLVLCSDLGADVEVDARLRGRVREVYVEGTIALKSGMRRIWQRWLLMHGCAHHVLHPSENHLYLADSDDRYRIDRHEREAEVFAGTFLFGPLAQPVLGVNDAMELAAWAEVPLVCTLRWLDLVAYASSPRVSLDRYDIELSAPIGSGSGEYRVPAALSGCG